MTLRLQDKRDEVERTAREDRRWLIGLFVIIAVIMGAFSFLGGDSLRGYEEALGIALVCFWAAWVLSPLYYEFHIRTK